MSTSDQTGAGGPLPDAGAWREQAEQSRAMIAEFRNRAQARGEAAEQATARMQAIEVEAWSPRREVRVVLGPTALITDIEFARGASTGSVMSLARAVQAAHDSALQLWEQRIEQITEETLGDDPHLRSAIQQAARQELPGRVT